MAGFDPIKKRIPGSLRREWVFHVLFWVIYYALNTLRWGSFFDDYEYSIKSNLVEFPLHIILVYFNLYFLMPRLVPGKILGYIGSLSLAVAFISFVRILLTYDLVTTDVYRESLRDEYTLFDPNYFLAVYIGELYVVGLTTAIKLMIDWVKAQRRTQELERRNQETELSFLRSQVQPHFFFNTLNNLYYLTLEKSTKAPETVLKLSELMSYVIYKGKKDKVSLHDEIVHIQNYIDLEKIRYGDKLKVDLGITGKIEDKALPPLLLLPFVENSFKHGINLKNGKIPIEIDLQVNNTVLDFSVTNQKSVLDKKNVAIRRTGIGIHNTKRRMEILFGDKFEYEIDETSDKYSVNLKLPLYEDQNTHSR